MKKLTALLLFIGLLATVFGAVAPAQNDNPCKPCTSGFPNRVVFFAYKWRKDTTDTTNGIRKTGPWNGFVKLCDHHSAPGWAVLGAAIYPQWVIAEETTFMTNQ